MGNIDDIISSGKAPGVIVRGPRSGKMEYSDKARIPVIPTDEDPRAAQAYEDQTNREIADKAQQAKAAARQRKSSGKLGGLRMIGSVSVREQQALERETGDPDIWRDPAAALKRIGKHFGD